MKKFVAGDRVVMVAGDEWADAGSAGLVTNISKDSASVRWDENGYSLWHKMTLLDFETDSDDPNILFKRRQHEL